MVVVDVNTGKFTGKGGNLEETGTKNNIEAAEEIARQLRLRDLGGIIVIDFIDMVLESNRDLVLRRLTECLGRDRTKHQVAEVTSLGLVQMTRKRIGQGLLEAFSTPCEVCHGRGVIIQLNPVDQNQGQRRHRHFEHRVELEDEGGDNGGQAGQESGAEQVLSLEADTDSESDSNLTKESGPTSSGAKKGRRRPAIKARPAKKAK
ncbi:ribonuclease E [mine drainage metagenome]|uniref:Ribonuclease E n=1 Tax=mine drainage metagenome TaxID=410659 RepID=A0A1J5QEL9_9ZZZZ